MELCLDKDDFKEISASSLETFEQEVAGIPPNLCAPFYEAAGRLDSQLLMLYRLVVRCSKKEDNLENVAQLWNGMVGICDEFTRHLEGLVKQHPYCGAEFYRDRFLDLRNTCLRLQDLHG
jgi:hypothetical protein